MNINLTLAALAAGILVTACGGNKEGKAEQTGLTVDVALPEIDSVTLSTTYPGELKAFSQVDVVGRVNGQLLSQNYTDGDFVKKGDVLFRIEDGKYRDAVQQADAALTTAISSRDYAQSHYEAVKKASLSDA
ncbi:MAG: biotin/lipoyl-binding protein, partial [Duncaniella sp.]|nr:biotin/lipoyl-binding protein [Duncaniella sp.]